MGDARADGERAVFRLSGAAAIAGGALRIADSFTAGVIDARVLEFLYFATDVLLVLGLGGWYFSRAERLGRPGLMGYVLAVAAILTIRSAPLFGAQGYFIGAGLLLLGLAVMNLLTLLRRDGPIAAPMLWLVALAFAVPGAAAPSLAVVAGVVFGLGFVTAGVQLWRTP